MRPAPLPFAFVDGGLDRAGHLRNAPERLAALWPQARLLLLDDQGRALGEADAGPAPVSGAQRPQLRADAVLLGLDGERAWFAAVDASDGPRIDLRTAAAHWPVAEATAFAQARAVLHWRARHRYCGACGTALDYGRGGWLGHCGGCGLEHYPRTDPAVIVAVSDGSRLLLGRQPGWAPRRYSTLAGFVEPGETLEQTVAREVFEESAVRVRGCRYLASQPWPFPSSLMLGFFAEAEPDTPLAADDELEDVRWFDRDQVGAALRDENSASGLLLSPKLSISRWLIERWYAGTDAGAPA